MLTLSKDRQANPRITIPPQFILKPTEGFSAKSTIPEKRYNCIVYTNNVTVLKDSGIIINSSIGNFATVWVTPDQILQMSMMPAVRYVQAPRQLDLQNDIAVGGSGASLLHHGMLNNTAYKGKNVIIGIFDTGIDWRHPDFRDPDDSAKSRILKIWDQTLTPLPGETGPADFNYGVEYSQTQINDELDGSPRNFVREKDINGHGTHVAGTAAGNGAGHTSKKYQGMAPEADIVVFKGSNDFIPEDKLIDAFTYLDRLATSLGKPAVMNISGGGQFGPHDGSRAVEIAADSFCIKPGRAVAISAGNDNQFKIHKRLILSPGQTNNFTISLGTNLPVKDIFRFVAYSNDNSSFRAVFTSPDGQIIEVPADTDFQSGLSNDSLNLYAVNRIDPGNNDRFVELYLFKSNESYKPITGNWILSITNNSSNTLILDGWLYYSFGATLPDGDKECVITTPGTSSAAITAAAYTGKNTWYARTEPASFQTNPGTKRDSIAPFSSRGPRRDGVLKPDIAADGDAVVSTLSSDAFLSPTDLIENGRYATKRGTSMATPGVAGAVALLFQANPQATAFQVKALIRSAANRDFITELPGQTPIILGIWKTGCI